MMRRFLKDTGHIYLALGATDFRKQATGLSAIVAMQFQLDPFAAQCAFLFCNRKKNSIKILRYDSNGFILAGKTFFDGLKFQWPQSAEQVKEITYQQIEWLLQGLEIEQKKALHPIEMSPKNTCF